MNRDERRERLKQMIQVIINGKNAGKQPGDIAKLAGMSVKDFKEMAPQFKQMFGMDLHFSPGLQLILPRDQQEMAVFVEEKVLSPEEKPENNFSSLDHIATMLMHVMFFRKGKLTEPEMKKIFIEKLKIEWDKPDSLHGGKSAKQLISMLEKSNLIKRVAMTKKDLSTQTMIENDNQRVLTWEFGARAKTVYNWEKIFRSGIKSIEQRAEEVLTENDVARARMHCKSQLDQLNAEKVREREKSQVYNNRAAQN